MGKQITENKEWQIVIREVGMRNLTPRRRL